jgi:Na+-translocating ferredoxin:NAD+ oxidoreductase RnfG subunit
MKNSLLLKSLIMAGVISITPVTTFAETYLTKDQAQQVLWQKNAMTKIDVILTKEQMKSIAKSSSVRVREAKMKVWKVENGGWFILDEVIGKHENIDIAVALTKDGKVKGVEILQYRETYGYEVREPKWLAQFFGKDHTEVLKLDKQIKNISGATLSCRHVTDGVNRLLHTWYQVLKNL